MRYLLLILFYFPCRVTDSTTEGYIYYERVDKYYKFHKDAINWSKARMVCHREGATLALPKNVDEVNILTNYFNTNYPNSSLGHLAKPNVMLLGFHDQFREDEYLSLTGEPLQYYYHKWAKNKPNVKNSQEDDCGSMYRNGQLNDIKCEIPCVFFCEKEGMVQMLPKRPEIVDSAYECHDSVEMCYKLHLNPKYWPEARTICFSEGGQLAVVNSKHIEWILKKLLTQPDIFLNTMHDHTRALIGIHRVFDNLTFYSVYDKRLSYSGYLNWGPYQPSRQIGTNCGAIDKDGFISSISCSYYAPFICERLKPLKQACECSDEKSPSVWTYTCYPKRQVWDEDL